LFETEKVKIQSEYNRLQMGIIKVAETRETVGEISLELEKKKVLVAQLQRECEEFLEKIVEQKNSASERERVNDFFLNIRLIGNKKILNSKYKHLVYVLVKKKFDVKLLQQLHMKN
jgi:hypothetical protein